MATKEELQQAVTTAEAAVRGAQRELANFEALAENNVFESLEKAGSLEDVLSGRAHEDCEGAGNCGDEEYTQEFMVDGVVYVATLTVEYNRHDKTYYYIDGSEFKIEPKAADQ